MGRSASYNIIRSGSSQSNSLLLKVYSNDSDYEESTEIQDLTDTFFNYGSNLPYDESYTRNDLINFITELVSEIDPSYEDVSRNAKQISICAAILCKMGKDDSVRIQNN